MLIGTIDIISKHITNMFNDSIKEESYPDSLKKADVTPIHKEKETTSTNRPVSLLPILSKLYEGNMSSQIYEHVEKYLSPFLFGYRKGYGTQHYLLSMIEMWRKALDDRMVAGAILTDLSKAFDCLKLEGYGFEKSTLNIIYD